MREIKARSPPPAQHRYLALVVCPESGAGSGMTGKVGYCLLLIIPDPRHWISEGPILIHLLVVARLRKIGVNRRGRREDQQERKGQEGRILPGKWDHRQKLSMKNDRRINFSFLSFPINPFIL